MSMHQDNPFSRDSFNQGGFPPPAKAGPLKWILGLIGVTFLVCCGGGVAVLMVIGVMSPETSVYPGNQVPKAYLETAREVGALEANETPKFFYSDGMLGIKSGFYLVTETKVSIYSEDGREPPLTVVKFDEIADIDFSRDESFLGDSVIGIDTKDGEYHTFPVSSEHDRDKKFFEAIRSNVPQK